MMADIAIYFLLQIVFTAGIIFLFGWLIALCNRRFYANFGRFGRAVCYITGFIGTPVHELSHAVFCLIFGHKIVEIKLFQINDADGTLGYVNHAHNRKNPFQRIGNFFIGVAPIVVISEILYLLAGLLLPDFIGEMQNYAESIDVSDFASVLMFVFNVFRCFFGYAGMWQWAVFIVAGIFLALHMTLSGADIKNAVGGLLFLLLCILFADIIIGFVSMDLLKLITKCILGMGGGLLCLLLLALIMAITALVVSFLFKIIVKR